MSDSGAVLSREIRALEWADEAVQLMHKNHCHPLPMVTLIFAYVETLGKPLAAERGLGCIKQGEWKIYSSARVSAFIEMYMPKLWDAFGEFPNRVELLGDSFRNGLVHELFMKGDCGIHETIRGGKKYVMTYKGWPSIEIDLLAEEFHDALEKYKERLRNDTTFQAVFQDPQRHALALLAPARKKAALA